MANHQGAGCEREGGTRGIKVKCLRMCRRQFASTTAIPFWVSCMLYWFTLESFVSRTMHASLPGLCQSICLNERILFCHGLYQMNIIPMKAHANV